MKIVKWSQLVAQFTEATKEGEVLYGLVIFDPVKSNWRTHGNYLTEKGNITKRAIKYKYEDCCYTFSSKNKYFDTDKFGSSLYACCLTGEDAKGVNIADYAIDSKKGWKTTLCVIFNSFTEMFDFRQRPRTGLAYKTYKAVK